MMSRGEFVARYMIARAAKQYANAITHDVEDAQAAANALEASPDCPWKVPGSGACCAAHSKMPNADEPCTVVDEPRPCPAKHPRANGACACDGADGHEGPHTCSLHQCEWNL